MDHSMGSVGGSGDDENTPNSRKGKGCSYKRLTSAQTNILEKFIRDFPRPDEAQRRQLAEEMGLDPKQIKFWFQNKRTQLKNQLERADNNALRIENDRIRNENVVIKEALKKILCSTCGGPSFSNVEHQLCIQKIQRENAELKEKNERASKLLVKYMEKQISQTELEQALAPIATSFRLGISLSQAIDGTSPNNHSHGNATMGDNMLLVHSPVENLDEEKKMMYQISTAAMEELVTLLQVNEPFWIKSSNTQDVNFTLHEVSYEQVFHKTNPFDGANVREESSKYSAMVNLTGMVLVDIFLDSDKWMKLFPTIVTKAETIKVFETGLLGNRDEALQLMNEQMHILSPLVRPRQFTFIRYCKQVDIGVWVITDVSFDYSRPNVVPLSRSWRHPSGCMIREMPNGSCMVTWIEHVEVDDKIHTHVLYRDLVSNYNLYGAKSWIKELQRMCERSASFFIEKIPDHESGGVIKTLEGRRSVMKLAHRMVKQFCESLTMTSQLDFPYVTMDNTNGLVRVSTRKTTRIGEPNGMVACAVTTLWVSLPYEKVFELLTDVKIRSKWDALSYGNMVQEIAHISNGTYPGNCTSIIQPLVPFHNNGKIIQESFSSPVGSYVAYAPVDATFMNVALRGDDPTWIPILPSGFVVCPDGSTDGSQGSLLTVTYQIITGSLDGTNMLNMDSVSAVNSLLTSTVEKVKDVLISNGLE